MKEHLVQHKTLSAHEQPKQKGVKKRMRRRLLKACPEYQIKDDMSEDLWAQEVKLACFIKSPQIV